MPKIETEHIVTDVRIPFWSVLKVVFKVYIASIVVGAVIGGVILLITFLMTGALVTIAPMLGM